MVGPFSYPPVNRHLTYVTKPGGVGTVDTVGCVGPHSAGGYAGSDSGSFTLTDPQGDTLSGTYRYAAQGFSPDSPYAGTFTVTEGTRKFRKVSGTISWTTVTDSSTGLAHEEFTGDLRQCHAHQCEPMPK